MSKEICSSCYRPKAQLKCGNCEEPVCKGCASFLDDSTFSFLKEIPAELKHTYYCSQCHATTVQPALDSYDEIMERAKIVYFFFKTQKNQSALLRKGKILVKVEACVDRDETILRLGFQAAEQGFNAIIEGEVICKKIRDEGYEKSAWQGTGMPAMVDAEKIKRNESVE